MLPPSCAGCVDVEYDEDKLLLGILKESCSTCQEFCGEDYFENCPCSFCLQNNICQYPGKEKAACEILDEIVKMKKKDIICKSD
jgi:hypothetical protein